MRPLTVQEREEHLKRKTLRLNLVEFFASGGKSGKGDQKAEPITTQKLRTSAERKAAVDECGFFNGFIMEFWV